MDRQTGEASGSFSGQSTTGAWGEGTAPEPVEKRAMRAHLCARVRDRWRAAELVAGPTQCEQSAHTEVCRLQFGIAAAQSLGLLQAAQRGSDSGRFFLRALPSGGSDSSGGSPKCGLDDHFLAGWMWDAAGNAHCRSPNSPRLHIA